MMGAIPAREMRRVPARARLVRWVLLVPGGLFMLAFFVVPMAILARTSLDVYVSGGGMTTGLTVSNYTQALTDSLERAAIIRTVVFSLIVTALTIVASYPIAFFLARTRSRWRTVLLVLAIAPLLTADVVRVYGWLVILSPDGLVNSALLAIHVIQQPLTLVYNETGALIGLVEILMPYAILTLFSALVSYDPSLEEASMSLGATRPVTFWRATLDCTTMSPMIWPSLFRRRKCLRPGPVHMTIDILGAPTFDIAAPPSARITRATARRSKALRSRTRPPGLSA